MRRVRSVFRKERFGVVSDLDLLAEGYEELLKLFRQVLLWDTGVMARGGTQPLVVEKLLPQELTLDRGGTRDLVWEQGERAAHIRQAIESSKK